MNLNNLADLARECPDIQVSVKLSDLIDTVNYCVQKTRSEIERQVTDANTETYPGVDVVCKMLNVSKSTLWRWNKDGYLCTVKIGREIRYRMSDIKKLLEDNTAR